MYFTYYHSVYYQTDYVLFQYCGFRLFQLIKIVLMYTLYVYISQNLGRVPMRRLVYRVQPLPQSMLPLVWDFGQLNTRVEELYIRQMVNRYVS